MKKKIALLCTPRDRAALSDLLAALRDKGVSLIDSPAGKKDTVLAVLSQSFYADRALTDALLGLVAAGAEVLPVQLDAAPVPDALKNALYARNILSARGRDPEQIAERIAAALPEKKSRLPVWLTLAGAAVLAVMGLFLWRGNRASDAVPAMAAIPSDIAVPAGLTAEELSQVRCIVLLGEHSLFFTQEDKPQWELPDNSGDWTDMLCALAEFNVLEDEAHTVEWYWHEDGSRISMTPYDLRFLSLLPNLEELHMAQAEVTEVPDLRGLTKLRAVRACDCEMDSLDWLAESPAERLCLRGRWDYRPLGQSEALRSLTLDIYAGDNTDYSAFSPPNLVSFDLCCWDLDELDLSGLSACPHLRKVLLGSAPLRDLDFLAGKRELAELRLMDMPLLEDVSVLSEAAALRRLDIFDCDAVRDLSSLFACRALEELNYSSNTVRAMDLGFLAGHPALQRLSLHGVDLPDVDFLRELGELSGALDLSVDGSVGDWSGLSGVREYRELNLDLDNGPLRQVTDHLTDAAAERLILHRFTEADLSALPRVTGTVLLDGCDLTDLSTMPTDWSALMLELENCDQLRSLAGLEKQSRLGSLAVTRCPRLWDWSALDGRSLSSLTVREGVYTLPDLAAFALGNLRLERTADIADLAFLDGMDAQRPHSFAFIGLDGLQNLNPLYAFHGKSLTVDPRLAEQAEDLVKAGNFKEFGIDYPQGGWDTDSEDISLTDLSELDELPPALLRHVERLCVALTPEGEAPPDALPGRIGEIGEIAALTGLRELALYAQPLESLDGVQGLTALEALRVWDCPALTDASAAFACQQLRALDLRGCPVESIQGAQNLWELEELDLSHTAVRDLTPLLELDSLQTVRLSGDMEAAMGSLDGREYHFILEY